MLLVTTLWNENSKQSNSTTPDQINLTEMPKHKPYVEFRGRATKARVYIWLVFGHFGLINLARGPSGE